jgi:HD-like signal output (HDOD) protein
MLPVKSLEKYACLRHLSPVQLILAAAAARIFKASPGQQIAKLGDRSSIEIFLLEGSFKLIAFDGKESLINCKDIAAKNPIAQLRPRKFNVVAETSCRYFILSNRFLGATDELIENTPNVHNEMYSVESGFVEDVGFLESFSSALWGSNFYLPCVTALSTIIKQYRIHGTESSRWLVNAIQVDPGLTVNIIATANDTVIESNTTALNVESAVEKLGIKTCVELCHYFLSNNPIKDTNPILWKRIQQLAIHSREIAFMAKGLAGMLDDFDAKEAFLCGILHNAGEIALIQFLVANRPDLVAPQVVNACIEYRQQAGSRLLKDIGMEPHIFEVAGQWGQWLRKTKLVDYVDLINIALIHCVMGRQSATKLPKLKQIPAFHRVSKAGLDSSLALDILKDVKYRSAALDF